MIMFLWLHQKLNNPHVIIMSCLMRTTYNDCAIAIAVNKNDETFQTWSRSDEVE